MSHHTWNYQATLRAAGYRVTPQRERLMDVVCAAGRRLTAQEVCDAVAHAAPDGGPAMNPATVYRNLRFLSERGLLRTVRDPEGRDRYALGGPASHHHLRCRACGTELEVDGSVTDAAYARIARATGFVVDTDHLVLEGLCAPCRAGAR